ncbi:hypothetical protein B5M09_010526 [Aphanomyces astaci]|uniref:Uncharacterized protein n=1 Tax=Aphanomyces astaci TaxID=112090 RepID=A0A425CS55_APHAT|nr:hypothetical protein B5M09_010526 [Aphanomyces astaci]
MSAPSYFSFSLIAMKFLPALTHVVNPVGQSMSPLPEAVSQPLSNTCAIGPSPTRDEAAALEFVNFTVRTIDIPTNASPWLQADLCPSVEEVLDLTSLTAYHGVDGAAGLDLWHNMVVSGLDLVPRTRHARVSMKHGPCIRHVKIFHLELFCHAFELLKHKEELFHTSILSAEQQQISHP